MAAETFQNVLHIVQTSGLNFRMEISAYSATIHLKNSLLKDKNGNPFILPSVNIKNFAVPKPEHSEQARQVLHQENVIQALQSNLEDAIEDCEQTNRSKIHLETIIETLQTKLSAAEAEIATLKVKASNDTLGNDAKTKLENEMNDMLQQKVH